MRIIGQLFTPLFWITRFSKLAVSAVANRIFLEAYTFYHSFRRDDVHREIENLDKAIADLEAEKIIEAKEKLSEIIKSKLDFIEKNVTSEMVLEALKAHRLSTSHLWRGVERNQTLIQYISDFITPTDSPLRPSPPTCSSRRRKAISFSLTPALKTLPNEVVEDIKQQLLDSESITSIFHPLQFFHTVRCQVALQSIVKNDGALQKLVLYVEQQNEHLGHYLESFATTYHIDQKQLEAHIRDKKWKEFVELCLP